MTRFNTKPLAVLLAIGVIGTCGAAMGVAQTSPTRPENFDSPDQAAKALIDAVSANDTTKLTAILGSNAQGILTSGNVAQDQQDRQEFSQRAKAKSHVERSSIDSSTAVLLIGDEDWPFPIPLVKTGQQWHFDPALGAVEMQARRIGMDELDAIEICRGYVNAQDTYALQRRSSTGVSAFAQAIMSSPGNSDGLYQPGSAQALVPQGLAQADAGTEARAAKQYHGYLFRVVKAQGPNAPGGAHKYVAGGNMIGGFALIAWPAQYGITGIHTFIVSHEGTIFEKDLGPQTAASVQSIVRYDPDSSWSPVE